MGHRPFEKAHAHVSLFEALLRARAEKGGKTLILEDHERKPVSYNDIVLASFALGAKLKKLTRTRENVGVLLPTSVGCTLAFFSLQAIGRVPAMLNFTAGLMNLKAACEAGRVRRILTSRKFIGIAKLESTIDELHKIAAITYLEDVRAKIGVFDKIGALIKSFAPHTHAAETDPDDTGVVLFTSGSYGAPRGAALSHANIVSNVEQCNAHVPFEPDWMFFNPLPMFHCFGLTGGTLLPLFTGHKAILYPSPLHFKEIPKLIGKTRANVLLATDTFAQQYARSASDEDLSCIRLMVCGAERVKDETRETYLKRFGTVVLEGYGATEASPVIAVNQPAHNRPGTVGRLLPEIEYKLEPVEGIHEGARLIVRGPNVMRGYLDPNKPGGVDVLPNGWHDTGDVVEICVDGFVRILGRVKRFAKIGGEMVSLNAVEFYASQVWPQATHAAVSVKDPRKGERLVLFTDTPGAEAGPLQAWAQANGAPDIAIPKKVVSVAEIPLLGSGKTDYVTLQKLAEEQMAAAA
jgi:acyl-[acyl-carrier-protein]-phospholipid O-acyltransferase/long-chain-fatty-acid--[acyl-carrier-protein] ligase